MDRLFFRSKEFKVGIIVSLLVLAGGVAVVASGTVASADGCTVRLPAGEVLDARPEGADETDRKRSKTMVFPAMGANVTVHACTDVGSIAIGSSMDDDVHVTTVVRAQYGFPDDWDGRVAVARMVHDGGRSHLSVWVEGDEEASVPWWFGGPAFEVDLEIRLPQNGTHSLDLSTDVGNIGLEFMRLDGLEARTDVGDVRGDSLRASGEIKVLTDVGDIDLRFLPVGDAEVRMSTDVGQIDLDMYSEKRMGHWVTVTSDVADIHVDIGPTERFQRDMRGAGGKVEARSEGYDSADPTWRVRLSTDVGDVSVAGRISRVVSIDLDSENTTTRGPSSHPISSVPVSAFVVPHSTTVTGVAPAETWWPAPRYVAVERR